jgi:uncharacterized protein with GYD domain
VLFCLTAEYTPQALTAMRENPTTNRGEAVRQLLEAAGGKLVSFYGRVNNGPGAIMRALRFPVALSVLAVCLALSSQARLISS